MAAAAAAAVVVVVGGGGGEGGVGGAAAAAVVVVGGGCVGVGGGTGEVGRREEGQGYNKERRNDHRCSLTRYWSELRGSILNCLICMYMYIDRENSEEKTFAHVQLAFVDFFFSFVL